ncbi:unnamed protein product, partial [Echinostoma caproni]|uniref:POU domain protein n=1 Tax=Echinostoma caproni TaxID=27848 RepID=A0A183A0G6_9TREM
MVPCYVVSGIHETGNRPEVKKEPPTLDSNTLLSLLSTPTGSQARSGGGGGLAGIGTPGGVNMSLAGSMANGTLPGLDSLSVTSNLDHSGLSIPTVYLNQALETLVPSAPLNPNLDPTLPRTTTNVIDQLTMANTYQQLARLAARKTPTLTQQQQPLPPHQQQQQQQPLQQQQQQQQLQPSSHPSQPSIPTNAGLLPLTESTPTPSLSLETIAQLSNGLPTELIQQLLGQQPALQNLSDGISLSGPDDSLSLALQSLLLKQMLEATTAAATPNPGL